MLESRSVLLAGAGGGYDVFAGLPLYFHLRSAGVDVHLANLSFTDTGSVGPQGEILDVVPVTADSAGPASYFPERYLCEWFREHGDEVTIHCFSRTGVAPLRAAYQALTQVLEVDTVLLVDGGTDSLMRGDEAGLGTPQEDIASVLAAASCSVPRKLLACIGFGVDFFHGVCHAHFLNAVAQLTRAGAFLGAFSLLPDDEVAAQYRSACSHVFDRMSHHVSIVNSSILSALAGHYGDYHATERTEGSELWINPLMSLYWSFRLDPIAQRCLYANEVNDSASWEELDESIRAFRRRLQNQGLIREWQRIPV